MHFLKIGLIEKAFGGFGVLHALNADCVLHHRDYAFDGLNHGLQHGGILLCHGFPKRSIGALFLHHVGDKFASQCGDINGCALANRCKVLAEGFALFFSRCRKDSVGESVVKVCGFRRSLGVEFHAVCEFVGQHNQRRLCGVAVDEDGVAINGAVLEAAGFCSVLEPHHFSAKQPCRRFSGAAVRYIRCFCGLPLARGQS